MRKWVLFSLLALAIGVASWWHFSRVPSVPVDGLGVEIASSQEWTPEQLRETRGEIVVGGNAPAGVEKDSGPKPLTQASVPSSNPTATPPTKPAELLATNTNTAAPAVAGEETYTIQKGDTLGAIAKKKYGSAAPRYVDAILKKNSLKSAEAMLKIGAKLVLPDPASLKK